MHVTARLAASLGLSDIRGIAILILAVADEDLLGAIFKDVDDTVAWALCPRFWEDDDELFKIHLVACRSKQHFGGVGQTLLQFV